MERKVPPTSRAIRASITDPVLRKMYDEEVSFYESEQREKTRFMRRYGPTRGAELWRIKQATERRSAEIAARQAAERRVRGRG